VAVAVAELIAAACARDGTRPSQQSTVTGHVSSAVLLAGCDRPGREGCPCRPDWTCDAGATCAGGGCYGARVRVPDSAYYRPADIMASSALGRAEVQAALPLAPGMVAMDLGAGRGWHTLRLAQRLGRGGKVYATDLQASELALLRQTAADMARDGTDLAAIETRVCRDERDLALDDLPPASVDAGLMTQALQLRSEARARQDDEVYLRGVARVIKPGGVFVFWQDWLRPGSLDVQGAKALFARAGFGGPMRQLPLAGVLGQPTWRETVPGGSHEDLRPGWILAVTR